MKKSLLRNYAKLIVRMGVSVQKGQEVVVMASPDQPDFVYTVVEEAYRAGASKVSVEYSDGRLTKLHVRHMGMRKLSKVEDWEVAKLKHRAGVLPCMIYLESEDPDVLKGIRMDKYAKSRQVRSKVIKPIRDTMDNKYQWVIAAVPGRKWAKKVFPELNVYAAVEKLWEYILKCARADGDDPCEEWKKHNENLSRRCEYLNSLGLDSLHITSSNGTDLHVGLIPDGIFEGGAEKPLGKDFFYNPNMPSEEIFTSPDKKRADGVVFSSRPFSYRGLLIKSFRVRFEGGKAVEITGSTDDETKVLNTMIKMDEGACSLGEFALVPYTSPIRETGIIYYNTLFDENAACHLALGAGFTSCLRDFEKYTSQEAWDKGINDSMIHEDFMVGTSDTDITGITADGKEIPIFRKGEWAF